jgi:nicotinate-nucleotide adenylyltransferase
MDTERIGIFGGTFDPPHLGHLILACEIRSQLKLDRLLWVLTPNPPHKQERAITALAHRLAMVRLAIEDNPFFELSRVEINREGPHYTVETLQILQEENPHARLIYLMGGDSLRNFPSWHRPKEIVELCYEIGVMRRPGDQIDLSELDRKIPTLRAKLRYVDAPLLEIASSEIRHRAGAGLPIRYYLPEAVYAYIRAHGLYGFVEQ